MSNGRLSPIMVVHGYRPRHSSTPSAAFTRATRARRRAALARDAPSPAGRRRAAVRLRRPPRRAPGRRAASARCRSRRSRAPSSRRARGLFDDAFRPRPPARCRWQRVWLAEQTRQSLPPISVVRSATPTRCATGTTACSVAHARGAATIDARRRVAGAWRRRVELIGGIERREIVIAEPDPAWPRRFEARASADRRPRSARRRCGSSTSARPPCPGLAAKPIVDVLVAVAGPRRRGRFRPCRWSAPATSSASASRGTACCARPALDVHVHVWAAGSPEIDAPPRASATASARTRPTAPPTSALKRDLARARLGRHRTPTPTRRAS